MHKTAPVSSVLIGYIKCLCLDGGGGGSSHGEMKHADVSSSFATVAQLAAALRLRVAACLEAPAARASLAGRGAVVPGQLARDLQEYLVDVVCVLGGRLHEEEGVLLGVVGGLLVLDHPPVGQVALVAGQGDDDVGPGLPLQLLHPGLGTLERVGVRYVVHHDGRLGAPEIASTNVENEGSKN